MALKHLHVSLLGEFRVEVDGKPVGRERWERPQATTLVKLLALAPDHRLHREQLIDALWPEDPVVDAAPRLHKLAHYVRRALGHADALVLHDEQVLLAPEADDLVVDAVEFNDLAKRALDRHDEALAATAADLHGAGLLPEDRYESWCEDRRRQLRRLYVDVLRVAGRWEDLLAVAPADEEAHLHLMQRYEAGGQRVLALRQYERMEEALLEAVGLGPSEAAQRQRDRLLTTGRAHGRGLIGREAEQARLEQIAARAAAGDGRALLVVGPTGIGKTAFTHWIEHELRRQHWAVASGAGADATVQAPGTPVLEALRLLADRHPDTLAALDDNARTDLTRAWSHRGLARPSEAAIHRVTLAAEELLASITVTTPVLLVVHRLDRAGHATRQLFHSLARVASRYPLLVVGTMTPTRPGSTPADLRSSLLDLDVADEIVLGELDPRSAAMLFEQELGEAAENDVIGRVVDAVGGNPLLLTEAARGTSSDPHQVVASAVAANLARLRPSHAEGLQRAALLGEVLPIRVLEAVIPEDGLAEMLDAVVATGLLVPATDGYRFRHPAVRAAVAASVPPHRRRRLHAALADRLRAAGAPPRRIAHHLLEAGDAGAAATHQLAAATQAWAAGAYEDALDLVREALPSASGDTRRELRLLRAQLLDALGDPSVLAAYADAIDAAPADRRPLLRALRARTAMTMGDIDAAEASLDGLKPEGNDADGMILLAQGMLAFFHGDLDHAEQHAREARRHALRNDAPSRLLDAITLDGLVAHTRGRWHERIREELEEVVRSPSTATVVFDSHLCVAEYLLYGTRDYDDVVGFARSFREVSEERGVARAEAFGATLEGEALFFAGDLDLAEVLLSRAASAHRALRTPTGEAHCTQRLAEVRVARGELAAAMRLLDHALRLARWSPLARHLLPRIYGTMIRASGDPVEAATVAREAEDAMGPADECMFCPVMFEVPATTALADAGRIDDAERHLELAQAYAARWHPSTWDAAVAEARAHVHLARREHAAAERLLDEAAEGFAGAGHLWEAQRCRDARISLVG